MMFPALLIILIAVLFLPFTVKKVEEQLELFLFAAGLLAVTVTSQWKWLLVEEALLEPVKITIAVLTAGLLFREFKPYIDRYVNKAAEFMGLPRFAFLLVFLLGLLSSVITAIIAALVLVEVVTHLKLEKKQETHLVILACFSIGLGAALTPIGEPLATIAISKLHESFWFIFIQLWYYIIPGMLLLGLLALLFSGKTLNKEPGLTEKEKETFGTILLRTGKVYLFVMALVLLGTGFKPIIDEYIKRIPAEGLYWLNIISAILDNATLTAAEISPDMSLYQIKAAILGLIIAGGMLIPGNIPNIIAANKLGIKSKDWAAFGVPVGFALMVLFFLILLLIK